MLPGRGPLELDGLSSAEVPRLHLTLRVAGFRVFGFGAQAFVRVIDPARSTFGIKWPGNTTLSGSFPFGVTEQQRTCNEKQFRGGLVSKSRRRLYHSSLGRE